MSSALIGESNATISTLTYSPKPEDHGRLLACQAFVEGIPGSIVEDSRRLHILCKFLFLPFSVRVVDFQKIYYYLKTNRETNLISGSLKKIIEGCPGSIVEEDSR